MSTTERLAQALREVLATLKRENERAEGPIKDTIWHGPAETLFDFIENTLGAHEAEKQAGPVAGQAVAVGADDTPALTPAYERHLAAGKRKLRLGEPVPPEGPQTPWCALCGGCYEWGGNGLWHHAGCPTRGGEVWLQSADSDVPVQNPAPPSPLAEQDKEDAESDMASPEYQAGWNAAMDAMTKAMTRVETLDAIRAARAKKEQP